MANICCENTDCIFCAQDRSCLYKFDIWISDNYYAGCNKYLDYMESEDYKTEFWKAFKVKDQEGKSERKKAIGKLIMINGRKFFTEDNPNFDDENTRVTDGELGTFAGCISSIKNNWDRYMERTQEFIIKNYSNVLDLPITNEKD